jgi:hypothetical protein
VYPGLGQVDGGAHAAYAAADYQDAEGVLLDFCQISSNRVVRRHGRQ